MKTRSHLTLKILITIGLASVVIYEFIQLVEIETQAQGILLEAETRSGNDFRTRSIKAIQSSSQDDIAILRSALITKADLARLADSLEKTGKSLGLNVFVSSITSETDTLHIKVETAGAWGPSLAYLHLLESLPYKTAIEETNLSVSGKVWRSSSLLKLTLSPEKI